MNPAARTSPLLFLELNEVNFELLRAYAQHGSLPTFHKLLESHGYARTSSEDRYEEIEPWIQWVTAHTGKTLAEHRVFRLGDIVQHEIPQVWEELEQRGFVVGAISPMNAKNRLRNAAFFVPDPWTATPITAPPTLRKLYESITQAVQGNAQSKVSVKSLIGLLHGSLVYANTHNWSRYIRFALGSRGHPWRRALFLDLLLADVFLKEMDRTRPDFASLFLNAAAHIQHHYLFSSRFYEGDSRNPEWYVRAGVDPVLEVYKLYDTIIAQTMRALPNARIMIGTGLHQNPHAELTFYWRLKDHAAFLTQIGVPFSRVEPLMSRDFLVSCDTTEEAETAQSVLEDVRASNGSCLFEVDNRGRDLFVMLIYSHDIKRQESFNVGGRTVGSLRAHVTFVAIKNGEHDGVGYFMDTGRCLNPVEQLFPLREVPGLVLAAVGSK